VDKVGVRNSRESGRSDVGVLINSAAGLSISGVRWFQVWMLSVTAGIHGAGYMTGTAVGKAVVCGRIAGRSVLGGQTLPVLHGDRPFGFS